MNVLIIGGSGFIGKHLTNNFRNQKNCNVYTVDLNIPKNFEKTYNYIGDIKDSIFIKKCIQETQPDLIYYLVSFFSFESIDDSTHSIKNSLIGLQNIFKNLGSKQKFIFIGSSSQYGRIPFELQPVTETCEFFPVSPYGVFKIFEEYEIRRLAENHNIEFNGARVFNVTGPGEPKRMVGGSIVSQLKNDPKIKIGNLKSKRDFLDVRDVADALVHIGKRGTSGEVYNVCSGKSISIQEYIELVGKELKINPIISVDSNRVNPNDIKDLVGDNTKIKKELGWNTKFNIALSITDIVKDINM